MAVGSSTSGRSFGNGALAFPGLPPAVLTSIDEQVALLDRDILDGVEPVIVEGEEDQDTFDVAEGEEGPGLDSVAQTTMEQSQSMDVSASMDMTIE